MSGLSCTAWRQHPTAVELARRGCQQAARYLRRESPWPLIQRLVAALVVAWIVIGWVYVVPAAVYLASRGAA